MIAPERFSQLAALYPGVSVAIVGDFCLDRYLEIDPARGEISIETNLPVHNVVRVRSQPGGAGTILNNLSALGIGKIFAIGVRGLDGEGYELDRALLERAGADLKYFTASPERRTFTYTKPLLIHPGKAPEELSRLDMKNWRPSSPGLQEHVANCIRQAAGEVRAIIVLDQVDVPETGVVTKFVLDSLRGVMAKKPELLVIGDSRRGVREFPPMMFKMNAAELRQLTGASGSLGLTDLKSRCAALARENQQNVCVTLAENGLMGASPDGSLYHVPALPLRGEIDIVGAGDSVTANLTAALAAGSTLPEALEIAAVASSIVIHQLGTTGTASVNQITTLLQAR
jgi:rfaE bifunctional protein kinase chain/domain